MKMRKGHDRKGRPLTEDTLNAVVVVKFAGHTYTTGNRKGQQVELFRAGTFRRMAKMYNVTIIEDFHDH